MCNTLEANTPLLIWISWTMAAVTRMLRLLVLEV